MEIKIFDSRDFPSYLPKLNELYDDLFSGGKGFRSKLIQLICGRLGQPEKVQHLLAQTIEFIHNASLLHDDLIDGSPLRRGKTAAWQKYTPEYAVLAGDYLLARVMVNLSNYGNLRLVQYTAQMISDLLEGEWLQDSLVGDLQLDLAQLDRVHNLKTASLFKWCLRSPFIAAGQENPELHTTLEEMGTLLGQLFQRGDDLLDFDVRNAEGKALMGDLQSGYVNSFAAFAVSAKDRAKLSGCKTLVDFKKVLGGELIFQKKLESFDLINQDLILLYKHHVQSLKTLLPSAQAPLSEDLLPLTDIMYWRKSK
jgi:octaprenyl-diphosphate synthase